MSPTLSTIRCFDFFTIRSKHSSISLLSFLDSSPPVFLIFLLLLLLFALTPSLGRRLTTTIASVDVCSWATAPSDHYTYHRWRKRRNILLLLHSIRSRWYKSRCTLERPFSPGQRISLLGSPLCDAVVPPERCSSRIIEEKLARLKTIAAPTISPPKQFLEDPKATQAKVI